jgi:hypothetical protein
MKSWRPTLEKIFQALEFANVASLRELEDMLDRRSVKESTNKLPLANGCADRKPIATRKAHQGLPLRLLENH